MRTVDRILAVSDIHGEKTKFLELLKKAEYDTKKDLLVVCGDIVDRGEGNLGVIQTCMDLQKKGAVIIKGNHEQFLEICLREMIVNGADDFGNVFTDNFILWVGHNGGATTYEEIKDLSREKLVEILKFIRSMPLYFQTGKYIFSHAGADARKTIDKNTEDDLIWGEEEFSCYPAYKEKIVVFGHTPTWLLEEFKAKEKNERENAKIWYDGIWKDKIGIDCGCVFGGRLAMLELPSCREFYV